MKNYNLHSEQPLDEVLDVVTQFGYKFQSVRDGVYTFTEGEEKTGNAIYLTVNINTKYINKQHMTYWGKWEVRNIPLPDDQYFEIYQTILKF